MDAGIATLSFSLSSPDLFRGPIRTDGADHAAAVRMDCRDKPGNDSKSEKPVAQPLGLGGTPGWASVLWPAFDLVTGATAKKNFAGLVAT